MKDNPLIINILLILIFIVSILNYSCTRPSGKVFPIEYNHSGKALEPSGITLYKGRLLFVSDNNNDRAVYELIPGKETYRAKILLNVSTSDLARVGKRFKLDLEGIVNIDNTLWCVDEKDRFIYKIKPNGRLERIAHDIDAYNKRYRINFSRKANAGFEGIAYDSRKSTFFIANERKDAVIYLLNLSKNSLIVYDHISMTALSGDDKFDISDICYYNGSLYLINRKGREIVKLDPYNKTIQDLFNYSYLTKDFYKAKKKRGFAEGLVLTEKNIYLLIDSDGEKMDGRDIGEDGAFVVIEWPFRT